MPSERPVKLTIELPPGLFWLVSRHAKLMSQSLEEEVVQKVADGIWTWVEACDGETLLESFSPGIIEELRTVRKDIRSQES
jgi:hypothetical protein